jgi:hypothetical protein
MATNYLSDLLKRYTPYASNEIDLLGDLLRRYSSYKNSVLIDTIATATSLPLHPHNLQELDPLAIRSIQDTNPTFDPTKIGIYSDDEWMGIVNSSKGKYFEYLVVEKLNAGESVGQLILPESYMAQLASVANQPGWDVAILNESGNTVDFLQLKATDSLGYIRDTLERYPDIAILTTDEAANSLEENRMVLDSDISESDLESVIEETLSGNEASILEGFWESFNPVIPLLVIVATEGYQVTFSQKSVEDAIIHATSRTSRSITAGAIAAGINIVTNSWLLSLGGIIASEMFFDRVINIEELFNILKKNNEILIKRTRYYQDLQMRIAI